MHKIFVCLLSIFFATGAHAVSLINDTEIERVVTELVRPIATAAEIPDNRLRVHIVRDDDFNAFVMGGDDVYIYTGLLTQIKSPDALQAVIAHELGHTIGGHMAQMSSRMAAEMQRAMLIQALGIGLMVAGGNPSLGAGVLAGSSGVAQQSMLAFTRDEERIADNMGLDLMVRAGQNPNGFIQVFEQMREISGAAESRVNPTRVNHPLTTERLKNVRDRIAKLNYTAPAASATRDAKFRLIQAKLIGYLDTATRVRELYPYSDKSDAAIYARAIASMQAGNLDAARVGTQTLISRHADNPYFYELLGDIEYQFGHYDDSVTAYSHSLKLAGNAPQIQTALALVLTERNKSGDAAQAIELCKRALLAAPAPLTYWVLARAYGDDDGRGDWARAEYYSMIGNTKNAKKYAKIARQKLKSDAPEYIKSGDILNKSK
mgnify:FL=1